LSPETPAGTGGPATGSAGAELRRIATLAWPVLVGQLAVIGFSTVDTVVVARHGRDDLAALSVGSAAYIPLFIGLAGVLMALGPLVGQLVGAGDTRQAGRQLHQSVWLGIALALIGGAVLVFPAPFFALAQAPAEVEARARGYLLALAVALPAALLMQGYRAFNNAIARPKAVMALQLGGLALKVPLSVLLVFGWPALGLPALGVLGCGIATAIVLWLQAGVALTVLRHDPVYAPYALHGRGLDAPDRRALAAQLRLGLPMGLAILIEVSGFTLMAIFIARLGATASAAHQIAANLTAMLFMLPLALANATLTLVAQRVGAGDVAAARRLGTRGLQLGLALAAGAATLLLVARGPIARLYTHDAAVLAIVLPLLAWVALFHVADALQAIAAFVLRAHRITVAPVLIYAGALWGVGLGGGYGLAFGGLPAPAAWRGAFGYWLAATAGLALAAAALLWLLAHVQRRLGGNAPLSPAATPG
jgi:MATE family multidrug resistance protein